MPRLFGRGKDGKHRFAGVKVGRDFNKVVMPVVAVAASVVATPAAGAALMGAGATATVAAVAAPVVASAAVNAGVTTVYGGHGKDILKSAAIGAASGGVGAAAGQVSSVVGQTAVKAVGSAAIAGATGGNVAKAILGSVAGSIASNASGAIVGKLDGLPNVMIDNIPAVVASAVNAKITDGDMLSALSSAVAPGIVQTVQDAFTPSITLAKKYEDQIEAIGKLKQTDSVEKHINDSFPSEDANRYHIAFKEFKDSYPVNIKKYGLEGEFATKYQMDCDLMFKNMVHDNANAYMKDMRRYNLELKEAINSHVNDEINKWKVRAQVKSKGDVTIENDTMATTVSKHGVGIANKQENAPATGVTIGKSEIFERGFKVGLTMDVKATQEHYDIVHELDGIKSENIGVCHAMKQTLTVDTSGTALTTSEIHFNTDGTCKAVTALGAGALIGAACVPEISIPALGLTAAVASN